MLGRLLEREVTRDGPEWAAAFASLTVSEKVKIKPSRRQHKENERDCRTIVQQLVSSIPQKVSSIPSILTKVHQEGRFDRLSTGRAAHYKNIKPHNPSTEDWCIPADMEEGGLLDDGPCL